MRPVNPKKSRVFSFLLGLIYGYRTADMELKILPLREFSPQRHPKGDLYYMDRREDRVSKGVPLNQPTHVVVLEEDHSSRKLRIYIYREESER